MAKTLVINGVNYAENKIETVTFIDEIPCTALSISSESESFDSIGDTATVTATVTPSNTTDALNWSTSDNTVASVTNGVITAVGVGTATITATCGSKSATCAITVRAFMNTDNVAEHIGYKMSDGNASTGGSELITWNSAASDYGGYYSNVGDLKFYRPSDVSIYPYIMPQNTGSIRVTIKQDSVIQSMSKIAWFNSQTPATGQTDYVKYIIYTGSKNVSTFEYEDAQGNKYADFSVPVVEGFPEIDSFAILFRAYGYTFTSELLDDVTVEFIPAIS